MEAFTAVLCLTPDNDPDLRSRFQSGSRPTLNSFLLWSLPPYSINFIKIRQVLYEKHWSGSQIFKIWPVTYEKHWSGSQIRISIRITPNFELGLPMIITSLLTKFHQNPTSSLWEILLTNKQTNIQTNKQTRKWHSETADSAKALNLSLAKQTNKQTDKQKILATQMFELSTLAFLAQFSYRLSNRAVLIWLLISDYHYQINKKFWPHRGSNSRPSHF